MALAVMLLVLAARHNISLCADRQYNFREGRIFYKVSEEAYADKIPCEAHLKRERVAERSQYCS
jgi:hypothetical protein